MMWDGCRDYAAALARLTDAGLAYPCACSRREIADSALDGTVDISTRQVGWLELSLSCLHLHR